MRRLTPLLGFGFTVGVGTFPAQAGPRGMTTALLVNGGYKAAKNYESHLVHLEGMRDVLQQRGIPEDQIVAFISDGGDPRKDMVSRDGAEPLAWMLDGTDAKALLPRTRTVDTSWDGPQLPATHAALSDWFGAQELRRGDTLMMYVTDHGYREKDADPPQSGLWLWEEKLTPAQLSALLDELEPGVRTVVVMSQCYSGAFASVAWADGPPTGDRCGYFSVPEDLPAYGCYPDGRTRAIGHGFRFVDALAGAGDLSDAHRWVNLADRTPDVPLRTSDLYLRELLSAQPDGLEAAVAAWLPAVSGWGEVDAIAEAFGLPPARSLEDLDAARQQLQALKKRFGDTDDRWASLRERAAAERLGVLLEAAPRWSRQLEEARGQEARDRLRRSLLGALEDAGRARGDWDDLMALYERDEVAAEVSWRLKTRKGALDRMEAALIRLAGEAMLADAGRWSVASRGLRRLNQCEATAIGEPVGAALPVPESYPDLDAEAALISALRPSFLGIRFEPVTEREARRLGAPGAVRVQRVDPDSPAAAAGIQEADVLTGLGGAVFQTPYAIQVHIALAERGAPVSVAGQREGEAVSFDLTLVPRD